jgi:hypothetical protein
MQSSACGLLHAGLLLGLLCNHEDGGDMFLSKVDFHQTVWHYIAEDRTLHHCYENLKSYIQSKLIIMRTSNPTQLKSFISI